MDWNGVVDSRLYSVFLKPFHDSVAVFASDHEQVVHGDLFGILFSWESDSFYVSEFSLVEAGYSPSHAVPLVEPSKLDPADRGVNSVQPRRISDTGHFVFRRPSTVSEASRSGSKFFIVRGYHAAVTRHRHVLAGVEGKTSR